MSLGFVLLFIGIGLLYASGMVNSRDLVRARRAQGQPIWREEREDRPAPTGLQPHDQPKIRIERGPLATWLGRASMLFSGLAIVTFFVD